MNKPSILTGLLITSILTAMLNGCGIANKSQDIEGSLEPITTMSQQSEDATSSNTIIGYLVTPNRVPIFDQPRGVTIGTSDGDTLAVFSTDNNWAKVKTENGYGWVNMEANGVSFELNAALQQPESS